MHRTIPTLLVYFHPHHINGRLHSHVCSKKLFKRFTRWTRKCSKPHAPYARSTRCKPKVIIPQMITRNSKHVTLDLPSSYKKYGTIYVYNRWSRMSCLCALRKSRYWHEIVVNVSYFLGCFHWVYTMKYAF